MSERLGPFVFYDSDTDLEVPQIGTRCAIRNGGLYALPSGMQSDDGQGLQFEICRYVC